MDGRSHAETSTYRRKPDGKSLHGRIVRELGQCIVSGELKPGDRLPTEAALYETYEVSRPVLREASGLGRRGQLQPLDLHLRRGQVLGLAGLLGAGRAGLARQGMAVLFISSEMAAVVRVSDRIAVLRDRRKVGELPGGSSEHAVYQLIAAHAP